MNEWAPIAFVALLVVAVLVAVVYFAASRIDRLHKRVDRSRHALAMQLTRRASVAAHLALVDLWDPVTSIVVASAADAAIEGPPDASEQSELTAALRLALGDEAQLRSDLADPDKAEYLSDLWQAWYRAQLARRFYNDAVAMTQRLRSRRAVRLFHLAGRVAMPKSCDIDDTAPAALEQLSASADGFQ